MRNNYGHTGTQHTRKGAWTQSSEMKNLFRFFLVLSRRKQKKNMRKFSASDISGWATTNLCPSWSHQQLRTSSCPLALRRRTIDDGT